MTEISHVIGSNAIRRLPHQPLLLNPVGKDYIWGGNRLHQNFNLQGLDDIEPLAEAWLCSTHKDGISTLAASGEESGENLREVLKQHPEYLGTHALSIMGGKTVELPILIKLIDARSDLSVQVHPNDTYAAMNEGGSLGKTEMWYVIDAEEGASLVYGLTREVTAKEFREAIEAGTLEKLLNRVPVQKGDVFFIRAGVIHAIGAGCLIAEVQESSNLTYRLCDYNRRDPKTGKGRELHVEKGLAVAELRAETVRQPMRTLRYRRGMASELLARCRYFQVERMLINTQGIQLHLFKHLGAELTVEDNSFHVLLCIDGEGILINKEVASYTHSYSEELHFRKGSCIFIPAAEKETCCVYNIIGQAELLNISC